MNNQACQTALDAFQELSSREDLRLVGVFERITDGCRDVIVLKFPDAVLALAVDADTDTIEVRCHDAASFDLADLTCINDAPPWPSLCGKSFGWGWVTINQQGYQDGVVLSFNGLEPSVMLNVAAASLGMYSIADRT
jgi:hypothetical protein